MRPPASPCMHQGCCTRLLYTPHLPAPPDPVAEFSRTLDQGVSADHARLHSSRLTGLRVPYDYGSYLPGYLVAAGDQLDQGRVLWDSGTLLAFTQVFCITSATEKIRGGFVRR